MRLQRNGVLAVWALLVVMFAGAGCSREAAQEGVVATVNGKPIYLHQLEARYDLNNLSWSGGMVPAVDALRQDYGKVLSELIVNELVNQTLESAGLAVSDAAVAEAEAVIRADYPEGQFEKSLVEEYIDIDVWRSMLRQQLSMETFRADVLRPRIKLTSQEAETYYKEHLADFYLPPRIRFIHISGVDREQVEKARDLYVQTTDIGAVQDGFNDITVRELRMRASSLPGGWDKILVGMEPGAASPVVSGENGFESLVLLENMPEKVLGPSQAYPLVEKVLLEQKLQGAFDDWLADELSRATIKVTSLLTQPGEAADTEKAQ